MKRRVFGNFLLNISILFLLASCSSKDDNQNVYNLGDSATSYYEYELSKGESVNIPLTNPNYLLPSDVKQSDLKLKDIEGTNLDYVSTKLDTSGVVFLNVTCEKKLNDEKIDITKVVLYDDKYVFNIPIEIHLKENKEYFEFAPGLNDNNIICVGYDENRQYHQNVEYLYLSFNTKAFSTNDMAYSSILLTNVSLNISDEYIQVLSKRNSVSNFTSVYYSSENYEIKYSDFESFRLGTDGFAYANVQFSVSPNKKNYSMIGFPIKIYLNANGNDYCITKFAYIYFNSLMNLNK